MAVAGATTNPIGRRTALNPFAAYEEGPYATPDPASAERWARSRWTPLRA